MVTETSIYEYARQGMQYGADRKAIWYYGRSISYGELFEKIDNVANHLYALGVREGTVVTIHLPNCPQSVMAIYAVAKLGGICNMVHALIPAQGVKENMEFSESEFLITYIPACLEAAKHAVLVDLSFHMGAVFRTAYRLRNRRNKSNCARFEQLEFNCAENAPVPKAETLSERCVAYLHSSGTTGTPKTVMHCHRALNNWVANAQNFFHSSSMADESLLEVLPLFHGSGLVMDMHQFITGGGTLVQMAQWDVKLASRFIKKYRVTSLTGVPRVYQSLLKCSGFNGKTIHQGYVSGDYVGEELKKAFNDRVHREACLYEGYGMTETVTACFSCGIEHNNLKASGYPLQPCRAAVLLPDNRVEEQGEGELLVWTNTMMLGYLKDSALTSESFYEYDGLRWLRTGDQGTIDEEGYVYFTERIKNTIIHNGYNIFPSEVEKVIRTVPAVSDVCVVGVWDDRNKTQTVRACVITEKNSAVTEEQIINACESILPRYAIPRQIRFLDTFPRNRMAKVDRKELEKMN